MIAAVECSHEAVFDQFGCVLAGVGFALCSPQPSDMGVPEPAQGAADAGAVAGVWAMGVAVLIGVGVVLAMVGNPVRWRAL
jgi:hypothetical protein